MDIWQKPSGAILNILEERKTTSIALPLKNKFLPINEKNVQLSISSGKLPFGMRLDSANIVGTPFEVAIDTTFTFVVRAEYQGHIDERTYKIIVTGPDNPEWVTPAGELPVGSNNKYFILDSAVIDFQLMAADTDITAGDDLKYYIQSGDGELPPGIRLTEEGKLVGITEPILAIEKANASGNYDSNLYSSYPFDFGVKSDNGFDSFYYDSVVYDTFVPTKSPRKLNRIYEFIVSVSDGTSIEKRKFTIFVVGDDFLRADNTIMQVSSGVFTADNTYIRTPIWLTPANLGYRRANNYITIFLDTLDLNTLSGITTYELLDLNPDLTASVLPTGMSLDPTNGELYGKIPYQSAVTKEFSFTIRALRRVPNTTEASHKDKTFSLKLLGEVDSTITWITPPNLGIIATNYASTLSVKAETTVLNSIMIYNIETGELPLGLQLSYDGEIIGKINSFAEGYYRSTWYQNRSYNLNDIVVYNSTLYKAINTHVSSLNFNNDAINWEVVQLTQKAVTQLDSSNCKFDQNDTTFDRTYKFTIKARDHYGYSATSREFILKIKDPDKTLYSNIYTRPLLEENVRDKFLSLVNEKTIFDDDYIYRPSDNLYGVQKHIQMLIYAGIETKNVDFYMSALATNTKNKKFKIGEVKTAVAKQPGTNTIVYEIVYYDIFSGAESVTGTIEKMLPTYSDIPITVDQSSYDISLDSVELPKVQGLKIETNQYGTVTYKFDPYFMLEKRTGEKIIIDINPFFINDKIPANTIKGPDEPYRLRPKSPNTIKTDSTALTIDLKGQNVKYISNVKHTRDNIKKVGVTELDFLPLWMRSSQGKTLTNLGFVNAIPLCYCKPGTSLIIANNVKKSNYNLTNTYINIDRFLIDSTEGISNEQYLPIHNYEFNN